MKRETNPSERYEEVRLHGWTDRIALEYDKITKTNDYEWAGGASRYEWAGKEGDIGPRNEQLEEELFHNSMTTRAGNRIEEYLSSYPRFFGLDTRFNPVQIQGY